MRLRRNALWLAVAVVVFGLAGLGVALGRGAGASPSAQAPPTPTRPPTTTPWPIEAPPGRPVYSAKFLCGFQADGSVPVDPSKPVSALPQEPPVMPGNYATEINIHNPQDNSVAFVKKAVLSGFTPRAAPSFEEPFPPGALFPAVLEPDWALEIDCPDIVGLLGATVPPGATFIKGFVVILSPQELDVVAVYTAERVDEHKNVECLLANGKVVEATLQADGTRKCPKGTVSIGVGQGTGTSMTMDVEYITPKRISPPAPPTPPPTPTPTPTPAPIPCPPSPSPTPAPTPSPSPTPSPTPSPGPTGPPTGPPTAPPTPSPAPSSRCWGDVRCDGAVDALDADAIWRFLASLPYDQVPGCPPIGSTVAVDGVPSRWGDVNCDGPVDTVDIEAIERFLAFLGVPQAPGCPPIGSVVQLT